MPALDRYAVELAQTIHTMFANGNLDPAATEIAEEHFPGKALGGEIIDGIRKRLPKVRHILEETFDHPAYLVSEAYYARFRDETPTTDADARRCLPLGQGVRSAGIRLNVDGDDDLIFQVGLTHNLAAGSAKVKKSIDRTLNAVEDGRMSETNAATLLDRSRKRLAPEKPVLAEKVLEQLPAKGEDQPP